MSGVNIYDPDIAQISLYVYILFTKEFIEYTKLQFLIKFKDKFCIDIFLKSPGIIPTLRVTFQSCMGIYLGNPGAFLTT